jgi:hypothetical protein
MKYFALLALSFLGTSLSAQEIPKTPEIPFRVVEDFLKIPSDMIMAEPVGVAINSKGHIGPGAVSLPIRKAHRGCSALIRASGKDGGRKG